MQKHLPLYSLALIFFIWGTSATAQIKKITAAGTPIANFNFLQEELKDARIVMLGEPSHQEGNVFTAKIELIKFLHEKMGYNVIAFESGFFELQQAQQEILNGADPIATVQNSLFPIWTKSSQFQPLLTYISDHRKDLKIIGFDPQFSANKAIEFLPSLKKFIIAKGLPYSINETLLSDVFLTMQDENRFPDGIDYHVFSSEMNKISRLLKLASTKEGKDRQSQIWMQNISSLLSMAKDFQEHKLNEKSPEEFRAKDSNPRDRQMAENLLFWSNRYPAEKIICWGASLHFSNQLQSLNNEELKDYMPMGKLIREKLGQNAVYTIGTLSAGGSYAAWFNKEATEVPAVSPGSLEYNLEEKKLGDLLYIPKADLQKMGTQTTSMFDYLPLSGDWSKVVDGILYFNKYEPAIPSDNKEMPVAINNSLDSIPSRNTTSFQKKSSLMNIKIRHSASFSISGKVLSEEDRTPISAATVTLVDTDESAISDEKGDFKLFSNQKATRIRAKCVGYKDTTMTVGEGQVQILLTRRVTFLDEVDIRPGNAKANEIVKKAILAFKTNHNSDAHKMDFFVDSRVSDKDSLLYGLEYTGSFYLPKDSHEKYLSRVTAIHWIKKSQSIDQIKRKTFLFLDGYGHINEGNVAVQHPMFELSAVSRYRYDLVDEDDDHYVIGFQSRSLSHAITNGYYLKKLSGQIIINKGDLAIIRTELNYLLDTATLNRFSRNYEKKKNEKMIFFSNTLESDQVGVLTDYKKGNDGYYYPSMTQILRNQKGIEIETKKPMEFLVKTQVNFFNVVPAPEQDSSYQKSLDLKKTKYDRLFWEKYTRPVLQ